MGQRVLFVSRHPLLPEQIAALQKIHGSTAVIAKENCRFEDEQDLLSFHELREKLYNFIYYVLPDSMKKFLKDLGKKFGVLCRPQRKSNKVVVDIDHYDGLKGVVALSQEFARKNSKNYHNRSLWSNRRIYR